MENIELAAILTEMATLLEIQGCLLYTSDAADDYFWV